MQPEVPQALRLQGILMGGVVIIYSRQTHFLLEDCKEVMVCCPYKHAQCYVYYLWPDDSSCADRWEGFHQLVMSGLTCRRRSTLLGLCMRLAPAHSYKGTGPMAGVAVHHATMC